MAAHRAWRAKTTAAAGAYIAWSEMQIRIVVGGADVTGGVGTAIADSFYAPEGLSADKAFDNDINTKWACNGSGTNSWLGWDFGATTSDWVDAAQFALTTRNDGSWGQNASGLSFDYSDDWNGSSGTWTSYFTASPAWTGAGQTLLFAPPAPVVGLDIAKIEDVAWLDEPAGALFSKAEATAWLELPSGLIVPKAEIAAWLDLDGLRFAKLESVAWLDSIAPAGHHSMSLM